MHGTDVVFMTSAQAKYYFLALALEQTTVNMICRERFTAETVVSELKTLVSLDNCKHVFGCNIFAVYTFCNMSGVFKAVGKV